MSDIESAPSTSSRATQELAAEIVRVPGTLSVRVTALAGGLFFVLILLYASGRGGAPSATASGEEIIAYVGRHQGRLQLGAVLLGLAMSAAVVALSGVFRTLRKAEGGTAASALVALGGGVLAAAATLTTALLQGTIASRVSVIDPSAARLWWTMLMLSTGTTLLGLLVLIGVTAVVCQQRRLFARWFAVASAVLALLSAIGAFTVGYDKSGIQVTAGIAVLLDTAWIFLVSIFLWRDPGLALP